MNRKRFIVTDVDWTGALYTFAQTPPSIELTVFYEIKIIDTQTEAGQGIEPDSSTPVGTATHPDKTTSDPSTPTSKAIRIDTTTPDSPTAARKSIEPDPITPAGKTTRADTTTSEP